MKLKLTFIALSATLSFTAFAQQTEKAALTNAVPEVATTLSSDSVAKTTPVAPVKTVGQVPQKVSFSLSAGTMFSNYGHASYLSPAMYYRLNNRFSVFSSVTYLNSNFAPFANENRPPMATKHYLVHVGGAYDVSDKLRLSGSVWRDFSGISGQPELMNGLKMPASYGTEFNASYKFSENFSVHGSIRTSHGNPYSSPYFNNYNSYNSGFGRNPYFGL
ncbi:hypothetical protein I5M27_03535 [Adhaeribacter sp. BT258]|uniref:Outer membrane protein beta-barrel domain-containing protein n=1 Tax=Adhaeribacter terrigena TaxID=2793070 RepID=A0ABS1BY08_9BACT|nr:hypothetical protein [Adhaeribacter terrigena]MBK0402042.1 hypothetical protein [Adhaeribacter terrigena]